MGKGDVDGEKNLKIIGVAGQGVKLFSHILAEILSNKGYEISLNLDYDSAVRAGEISADLIYSKKDIINPIIDEADLLVRLGETKDHFRAKEMIVNSIVADVKDTCSGKVTRVGFTDTAQSTFESKRFVNMLALGRMLKFFSIDPKTLSLKDFLPSKFVENNIKAIQMGYELSDDK